MGYIAKSLLTSLIPISLNVMQLSKMSKCHAYDSFGFLIK